MDAPIPPSWTGTMPPGYRDACLCTLGWAKASPRPPTINDLLPPEMLRQSLELWLATGTNVLYNHVLGLFGTLEDGGMNAVKLITDSLEADIFDRLDELRTKWEGEKAA